MVEISVALYHEMKHTWGKEYNEWYTRNEINGIPWMKEEI
jgi:hypothetical protein